MIKKLFLLLLAVSLVFPAAVFAGEKAGAQPEEEIGNFDITDKHREMAAVNEGGYTVIDAGRGNPNWINTRSRYAFARFMEYALTECERTMNEGTLAGQAGKKGI